MGTHYNYLLKVILFASLLVLIYLPANAQSAAQMQLKEIAEEADRKHDADSIKVREFAARKNLPIRFVDSQGNSVLMIGVSSDDKPIYIATVNAGAAVTTGVVALRTGGGLGLNLEGQGMVAGVWDGGAVRTTHKEIAGRIISTSGPEGEDHPSHVTGTIIASGVNPAAKGMAPKAQVKSYYFDNDMTTITANAPSMILSNHSYGIVLGWRFNNGWTWVGNGSISNTEDYRFGFYTDKTRQIDQVAVNAPNYLMVWAAGNERNNTGAAGHPPDCNSGAGYDCIGLEGVAKNIMTVGAVTKVPVYTDPSSVIMSSFSSWGPTDDGRIKPDVVGAGVSLFSLSAANDSAYATISGTSMASPNVTGSLLLLQELYKNLHAGSVMRASTLKALALHTTKEAGQFPGPDYRFGWGLLDDAAAAKVLLDQNDLDVVVKEVTLASGETFEMIIDPKPNEKITATIAWTDPAGPVLAAALDPTDLMLVNDLDMRLKDDANNTQFPWILNPASVGDPATTGDNIRDNVEKIEFNTPEARPYKLQVKGKNAFGGGTQVFSLILTYQSIANGTTRLYWVGGSGNWSDPNHWSLTSGGPSAGTVPTVNNRVFFDENSFSGNGATVSLDANAICYSLSWLTQAATNVALNGNTLTIDGSLNIPTSSLTISTAGNILLAGEVSKTNSLYSSGSDLSKAAVVIDEPTGVWTATGNLKVGSITLNSGQLIADGSTINTNVLTAVSSVAKTLSITDARISSVKTLNLNSTNLTFNSDRAVVGLSGGTSVDPITITNNGVTIAGKLFASSTFVKFVGAGTYSNVDLSGSIEFVNDNVMDSLKIRAGSTIKLGGGSTQKLTSKTNFAATSAAPITIIAPASATLNFADYFKLCFDNLVITNVNVTGAASINAGANSTITNSANWEHAACESILFPDFDVQFACANSLTMFTDQSLGTIDSWSWNFGDAANPQTSTKQAPNHKFATAGTYAVTLTVKKGAATKSHTENVVVGPNALSPFEILLSGNSFFSVASSPRYQWYKNDDLIVGATERTYKVDGASGVYYAVIFDATCNLPSVPFVTVSVKEDMLSTSARNLVYPNPSRTGEFNVSVPQAWLPMQVSVFDMVGNLVTKQVLNETESTVQLSGSSQGMYIMKLSNNSVVLTHKIEVIK